MLLVQRSSLAQEQLPKSRAPSALWLLPVLILRSTLDGPEAAARHWLSPRLRLVFPFAFFRTAKCIDILRRIVMVETGPAPGLFHR